MQPNRCVPRTDTPFVLRVDENARAIENEWGHSAYWMWTHYSVRVNNKIVILSVDGCVSFVKVHTNTSSSVHITHHGVCPTRSHGHYNIVTEDERQRPNDTQWTTTTTTTMTMAMAKRWQLLELILCSQQSIASFSHSIIIIIPQCASCIILRLLLVSCCHFADRQMGAQWLNRWYTS